MGSFSLTPEQKLDPSTQRSPGHSRTRTVLRQVLITLPQVEYIDQLCLVVMVDWQFCGQPPAAPSASILGWPHFKPLQGTPY